MKKAFYTFVLLTSISDLVWAKTYNEHAKIRLDEVKEEINTITQNHKKMKPDDFDAIFDIYNNFISDDVKDKVIFEPTGNMEIITATALFSYAMLLVSYRALDIDSLPTKLKIGKQKIYEFKKLTLAEGFRNHFNISVQEMLGSANIGPQSSLVVLIEFFDSIQELYKRLSNQMFEENLSSVFENLVLKANLKKKAKHMKSVEFKHLLSNILKASEVMWDLAFRYVSSSEQFRTTVVNLSILLSSKGIDASDSVVRSMKLPNLTPVNSSEDKGVFSWQLAMAYFESVDSNAQFFRYREKRATQITFDSEKILFNWVADILKMY